MTLPPGGDAEIADSSASSDLVAAHPENYGCWSCRRERKRLADLAWAEARSDLSAGLPSPKEEARALLALVQGRNGGTEKAIEEVRALIAVPPATRRVLRAYSRKYPEARRGIRKVLKFRLRVAEEFERLLEGGGERRQVGQPLTTTPSRSAAKGSDIL